MDAAATAQRAPWGLPLRTAYPTNFRTDALGSSGAEESKKLSPRDAVARRPERNFPPLSSAPSASLGELCFYALLASLLRTFGNGFLIKAHWLCKHHMPAGIA